MNSTEKSIFPHYEINSAFIHRSLLILIENSTEMEWNETVACASVELAHELDPVETQSVQEGRKTLHHDQDGESQAGPGSENREENSAANVESLLQSNLENHVPQDLRKF